jgi:peptide chain release factor 2
MRTSLFSGPYDEHNASCRSRPVPAGPKRDWAEMLLRMYLRWAQRRFATNPLTSSRGEEGRPKAQLSPDGRYAYGNLRAERGVHWSASAHTRLSERRHTTRALVEVLPEVADDTEVGEIPERAAHRDVPIPGAGGRTSTDSAVRLTHIPTGITAQSQNGDHLLEP